MTYIVCLKISPQIHFQLSAIQSKPDITTTAKCCLLKSSSIKVSRRGTWVFVSIWVLIYKVRTVSNYLLVILHIKLTLIFTMVQREVEKR